MDFQNIRTVKELRYALKQHKQTLATTIFNDTRNYISVTFKREVIEKDGKSVQFLCFYPNYEAVLYPVETLLAYLEKLPEQAIVTTKDHDDNHSSLFLTIDGAIDQGDNYQWLVINDKNSYERFFFTAWESTQEQAFEKILKELGTDYDSTLEVVHNWLRRQTDEALFLGILKEDRTLKGAMTYCIGKTQGQSKDQSSTTMADEVVFSWIKEHFLLEKLPEARAVGKVTIKRSETKPEREEVDEQIDLFKCVWIKNTKTIGPTQGLF